MKKNLGFTLAETLMVVSITVVVSVMVFFSFSSFGSTEILTKEQARVVSVLEKARAMTLDSYNNSMYGVHFSTSSATIFEGATFNASSTSNIVTSLNSKVIIQDVDLNGDGLDIIFNRLSGETNQAGTTTLALVDATSSVRTIKVFNTGLVQAN